MGKKPQNLGKKPGKSREKTSEVGRKKISKFGGKNLKIWGEKPQNLGGKNLKIWEKNQNLRGTKAKFTEKNLNLGKNSQIWVTNATKWEFWRKDWILLGIFPDFPKKWEQTRPVFNFFFREKMEFLGFFCYFCDFVFSVSGQ